MEAIVLFFQKATVVDMILVAILLLSGLEGYALGVVISTGDLIKFITSFIVGLKSYAIMAIPIQAIFHTSKGYSYAIGFFLAAFITEVVLQIILSRPIRSVNNADFVKKSEIKQLNNILGILPGVISGGILLMFALTVLTTLPVSPFVKRAITTSQIGSFLVDRSQGLERSIAGAFGGAAHDTLNFLTIEPKSNSSVSLGFTTSKGVVDKEAENQMLLLLNLERSKRGLSTLVMDTTLQQLARDYAQEMLMKGYFSHYTPDNLSPFDRMEARNIVFSHAGENLAFSANVDLAMQGLMNSPGHKANMLSISFKRVGIGVIDAGIYGEMFVQEFTD